MLSDGARTYSYDAGNRLTSVSGSGTSLSFGYNGLGERIARTEGVTQTQYIIDEAADLPEVIAAGDAEYIQINGQVLASYEDGQWRYFLADGLGSVRAETNAQGEAVLERRFDPYGKPLETDGGEPFGYTGEPWEASAGLLYLRARYYQPATGRFIQPDPGTPNERIPQDLDLFSYVRNNPVNYSDPSGLIPVGQLPPNDNIRNELDLTSWFYRELKANVNSYYVQHIRILNRRIPPNINNWYKGGKAWENLVKDRAKWDFKHLIEYEIGKSIAFLDFVQGYRWYDYSVPGNIFYGHIGSAAGFEKPMLHGGAGYPEITDPAHNNDPCQDC